MPRQVNKKVLFGILAVFLVLVGVAGLAGWRYMNKGRRIANLEEDVLKARQDKDAQKELFALLTLTMEEPDNLRRKEEYARRLEETGDYSAAVFQWRAIATKDPNRIEPHLKLASAYLTIPDYDTAKREATEVIQRDPGNFEARLLLARTGLGMKSYPEAVLQADEALKLKPDDPDARLTKIQILMAQKDQPGAEAALRAALEVLPEHVDILLYAGGFYQKQQQWDQAETAYEAALSHATRKAVPLLQLASLAVAQRKDEEAESYFRQAITAADGPVEKVMAYGSLASFLTQTGKPEEALTNYAEALVVMPKQAEVLAQRAGVLLSLGRLDDAETDIQALLTRMRHDRLLVQALLLQGHLELARGDLKKAVDSFKESIRENQDLPEPASVSSTSLGLAMAYTRLGQNDEAKKVLEGALSQDQDNAALRLYLARLYSFQGEYAKVVEVLTVKKLPLEAGILLARAHQALGNVNAARQTLLTFKQAAPDNPGLLLELAQLESTRGDASKALEYVEEVLKLRPDDPAAYLLKARTLATAEKYAEADKLYNEIMAKFPEQYSIPLQYAQYLLSQGQYDKGEQLLRKVQAESTSPVSTDGFLASYYLSAGKTDLARAEYRSLAEKYPDSIRIKQQLVTLAVSAGDFAEADKYLEKMSQTGADPATVTLLRAQSLLAQRKYAETEKLLGDVLKGSPDQWRARYFQAQAQINLRRLREARLNLEQVVQAAPYFWQARRALAGVYMETGRPDLAEPQVRILEQVRQVAGVEGEDEALERMKGLVDVFRSGPAEAEAKLRKLLETDPDDPAALTALAEVLYAQNKNNEAEATLHKAWERNKTSRQVMFALVRYYLRDGKPAEALTVAQGSLAATGDDVGILAYLAQIHEQLGQTAQVEADYAKIEQLDPKNPLPPLHRAQMSRRTGNLEEATRILQEALVKTEDNEDVRAQLAEVLLGRKLTDQALSVLDEGLKKSPNSLKLLSTKAAVLTATGRGTEAEELLKRAIQAQQAGQEYVAAALYDQLADIYLILGNTGEAEKALQEVKKLLPADVNCRLKLVELYLRQQRWLDASLESAGVLRIRPVLKAYLALGDIARAQKNANEALQYYGKATEVFPAAFQPWQGIAAAQLMKSDVKAAEQAMYKAIELSDYDPDVIGMLVEMLVRQGMHDRAIQICDQYASKVKQPAFMLRFKGQVEMDRKQYDQARAYFEEARKAQPQLGNLDLLVAQTYLAQKDYQKVVDIAEKLLDQKGVPRTAVYDLLLQAYRRLGRQDKIEEAYRQWIKLEPDNPVPANNLAYELAEAGRPKEALAVLDACRKTASSEMVKLYEPELLDTEGWVYYKQGDYGKARGLLQRALDARPNDLGVMVHLRSALEKLVAEAQTQGRAADAQALRKEWNSLYRKELVLSPEDAAKQYELAKIYLVEGNVGEAINALSRSLQAQENKEVRQLLVENLLRAGRVGDADRELAPLRKDQPNDPDTTLLEAMYLLARPETQDQGRQKLQDLLKQRPDHVMAHYLQAQVYLGDGQVDDAARELDQTIRLKPGFLDAMVLKTRLLQTQGKSDEAIKACDDILAIYPDHVEVLVTRGNLLAGQGKLQEAETWFRDLVKRFPQSPITHARLAAVLAEREMIDAALQEYHAALALQPNSPGLLQAVCDIYVRGKRPDLAVEEARAFLARYPDSAQAYILLGQLYEGRQSTREAETAYQAAVRNGANDPVTYLSLAQFYLRTQRPGQAQAPLDKMLEAGLAKSVAWQFKGLCYEQEGNFDKAEQAYRSSFKEDPRNVGSMNNLAWILLTQKSDVDGAIRLGEEAVKISPDFVQLLDTLGWAYYTKGDRKQALTHLEKAYNLSQGKSSMVAYHLGRTLVDDGQASRGKDLLNKVLEMDPNFKEADKIREILQKIG